MLLYPPLILILDALFLTILILTPIIVLIWVLFLHFGSYIFGIFHMYRNSEFKYHFP
jgi:hypothetical protein